MGLKGRVNRDGERRSDELALVSGLGERPAKFATIAPLQSAKVERAADEFNPVDLGSE